MLEKQFGFMGSDYIIRLRRMIDALSKWNPDCQMLNYATHTPYLVNKELMKETLNKFPDIVSYRGLYGNYNQIGGINCKDVKYNRHDGFELTSSIISTSDNAFKNKFIGELIREEFQEKTIYERD